MAITAKIELERFSILAARTGCAQDQMARFLTAGYVPQAKQLEFHAAARECDREDGPEMIGYGGTRGQAKTHAILAQVAMDDCQRFPGLKVLYLRKIQASAGEQLEDLVNKLLVAIAHLYNSTKGRVKFPNDSGIIIGGFKDEKDIDKYIGIEYDLIIIEDATTLTKIKIDQIRGSLRTSKEGWRPRIYMATNPGGIGHAWFKKMFVDPWTARKQTLTRFIHTTMGDNVFINEGYARYLNSLTGWLRRAWRDGDFTIAAGQYFTTFGDVHVIEPIGIDRSAIFWASMDYGLVHWTIVYLFARQGENIYVIDEYAARRQLVKQNAQGIHGMLERNGLTAGNLRKFPAGHDVFATREKDDESTTLAKEYADEGIELTRAITDRVNGAGRISELLGNPNPAPGEEEILPRLFIFNHCHRLIETLPQMQHDPYRGEDVLKVDCDPDTGEGGDDAYDALRYGLMEEKRKQYPPPGSVRYA